MAENNRHGKYETFRLQRRTVVTYIVSASVLAPDCDKKVIHENTIVLVRRLMEAECGNCDRRASS